MSADESSTTNGAAELFGERVARLMKEKGLNQTRLAEKTGIERTQLNRLLKGRRQPQVEEVAWLAEALGVEPSVLLDGIELPPKLKTALDQVSELAARVLAAERERDEAAAKLIDSEARRAAESARWAGEREELQRAFTNQRGTFEANERHFANRLTACQEDARMAASRFAMDLENARQDNVSLVASNEWLQNRVRQLEGQLAHERSQTAATAFGAGSLALLVGLGIGSSK